MNQYSATIRADQSGSTEDVVVRAEQPEGAAEEIRRVYGDDTDIETIAPIEQEESSSEDRLTEEDPSERDIYAVELTTGEQDTRAHIEAPTSSEAAERTMEVYDSDRWTLVDVEQVGRDKMRQRCKEAYERRSNDEREMSETSTPDDGFDGACTSDPSTDAEGTVMADIPEDASISSNMSDEFGSSTPSDMPWSPNNSGIAKDVSDTSERTPADILTSNAETYRSKTDDYGDAWYLAGATMAMWADELDAEVDLTDPEQAASWNLYMQRLHKLLRGFNLEYSDGEPNNEAIADSHEDESTYAAIHAAHTQ